MSHSHGRAVPARAGAVIAIVVAVLATVLVVSAGPASASPEHELLAALNRHRGAAGLAPLQLQGDIHGYARGHAADMAAAGRIWHGNVSAAAPAGWRRVGEAVASAQTAQELADVIMSSPSHRALVLDGGFTWAGSGVAAGHGRFYAAVPLMDHPDPNGSGGQTTQTTEAPPPPPTPTSTTPPPPPTTAGPPPASDPTAAPARPQDAGMTLTAAPEGPPAGVGTAGPPAGPTPPHAVARSLDGLRDLDKPASAESLRATAHLTSVLCRACTVSDRSRGRAATETAQLTSVGTARRPADPAPRRRSWPTRRPVDAV